MQGVRLVAAILALGWVAAAPAQLFSDSEARRNIEVLRKEIEQQRSAIDERLRAMESSAADRRSRCCSPARPRSWRSGRTSAVGYRRPRPSSM